MRTPLTWQVAPDHIEIKAVRCTTVLALPGQLTSAAGHQRKKKGANGPTEPSWSTAVVKAKKCKSRETAKRSFPLAARAEMAGSVLFVTLRRNAKLVPVPQPAEDRRKKLFSLFLDQCFIQREVRGNKAARETRRMRCSAH